MLPLSDTKVIAPKISRAPTLFKCVKIGAVAGFGLPDASTVPLFVKQDSTILPMNSEIISNAITNSVVTVSDEYLQWLP